MQQRDNDNDNDNDNDDALGQIPMLTRHPAYLLLGSLFTLAAVVFAIHHEIAFWPASQGSLSQGSGTLRYVHVPKEGRHAAHWALWLDRENGGPIQLVCRDGAPCPMFNERERLQGQRAQAGWAPRHAFFTLAANEMYQLRVFENGTPREVLPYDGRYYAGGREKWILRALCFMMLLAGLGLLRARR